MLYLKIDQLPSDSYGFTKLDELLMERRVTCELLLLRTLLVISLVCNWFGSFSLSFVVIVAKWLFVVIFILH